MTHQPPETIKDEVRSHYSRAILAHERSQTLPSFGCGNPFAIAALKPGERVLDLGSGPGLDVLLASRLVGEHGVVYALDMTDEMLEAARENIRKARARNVVFIKGDIEAVPLPDESVDVIISNCVVNLAPDKARVAAEAFRVLRRSGRLAISDIVVDADLEGLPLDERQIRANLSWSACMAGALTITNVRSTFAAAGFADVRVNVVQRFSRRRFASRLGPEITALPVGIVDDLVGRFTSSLIFAVKP
jgi:arsenite methyltransferase